MTDVRVHTWITENSRSGFPEIDNPGLLGALSNRPSFGIAFSGGGTRSAAATLGQIRALCKLGWVDQARYMSANSGGTWTSVPFVYLPPNFEEARFLGDYIPPDEICDATLKKPEDPESMEGCIFHARLATHGGLSLLLWGDEGYSRFVGNVFLNRFELHDREGGKCFSFDEEAINRIRGRNPALASSDFYQVRQGRPFLIVVGTMLAPSAWNTQGLDPARKRERYLFEATPLYVGVGKEFECPSNKDGSGRMLVGGGYVDPFGYDSDAPTDDSNPKGCFSVSLGGDRHRFTLSDMIGMSSAAPAIFLANNGFKSEIFPEFRHWAVDRQKVISDSGFEQEAVELKHGDGGDIDNLALLPLLARGVQNILVFVNTRRKFNEAANLDAVTTEDLVDDVVSLFRATEELPDNVVFEDGATELARLCGEFKRKREAGEPLVHCQSYRIRDNDRQRVRGDGYTPTICWVYLDCPQRWLDALPASGTSKLVDDIRSRRGDFKDFPHYKTFGEGSAALIDLDRERVRALSNLAAWTVFESRDYIAQHLDL
ncbi:MAG: hypothetical protein HWD57_19135 [Candidatus Accumulibacter cognatus]|uniref:PNPLA domain-containing protein n=1 Tax=Candidatus Accumulibacter cognatus TaxID=2954383 RepID=A0A7D5ND23_9PROT|nr:MAG: hypothetical protein HWD57_19135 [Candidatus Accumulibacter cognatus]